MTEFISITLALISGGKKIYELIKKYIDSKDLKEISPYLDAFAIDSNSKIELEKYLKKFFRLVSEYVKFFEDPKRILIYDMHIMGSPEEVLEFDSDLLRKKYNSKEKLDKLWDDTPEELRDEIIDFLM